MSAAPTVSRRIRMLCAALIVTAAAAVVPGFARAEVPNPITALACFGAPARSLVEPCVDPSLRRTVYPAPQDAPLEPNAECLPTRRTGLLYPCSFGARTPATTDTIALIG
ncbi:MAG: hypothetical protein QOJ89_4617, partial [bacterium]